MGTVFSIDIREAGEWESPLTEVVAWLHHVDATFSTYRADSDISRMHRGELRLPDADPAVAEVLELCAEIEAETGGHFTARRGRTIDPTGLVKGWAIDRAAAILTDHGADNFAVNGGGDVLLRGYAASGEPWRVGIADPHNPARLITVVADHDFAVATSGTAQRGRHIIDPGTGSPASTGLSSATVIGPSIVRADGYATAAFVIGREAHAWMNALDDYRLLTVADDGTASVDAVWPHHGA